LEKSSVSSPESNKAVVQQYVDAFNHGDFEQLRSLFTPDAAIYGVLGFGSLEVAMPVWQELHHGLGMKLTVEALVAEGDVVAARYTERGTFVGPFRGHEPTGRSYEMTAMEWFELKHGKIHRRWGARDAAAQARQLGLA
jgi:predicted ester cyclase